MDITMLCKVVDNYGDIGFVFRLARALTEADQSVQLRLIVSDLDSFSKLEPSVQADMPVQTVCGWTLFDWNNGEVCQKAFTENPPDIILECFQCGRPDWLEDLLFGNKERGIIPLANEQHIVRILNIDYLTAESYADDFHCLKSGTRSMYVKKVNFMPGFTAKTAGLTLDKAFMQSLAERTLPKAVSSDSGNAYYVPIFSYERDFTPIVSALERFQAERRANNPSFTVHALVAAGKSASPFFEAWRSAHEPFPATALPFLAQAEWDKLLCAASFSLVRGEDSLSRATLAGRPFLWHAYPQEDEYQTVKVQALLERLRAFVPQPLFEALECCWLSYNKQGAFDSDAFLTLLLHTEDLTRAFSDFSNMLIGNGNFAEHLLAYLA